MLEIIGIVVMIQGALGFAGPVFFDRDMGLLHQWVDLPPVAYIGIAVAGAVVMLLGTRNRTAKRRD